jgi:hypothetical protein
MEVGVCSAHMDPQEGGDYKQTLQGKCVVTTLQVTVTNPSQECGWLATTLTTSPLPDGWMLRTCVPIIVSITLGNTCGASRESETSWRLLRSSDGGQVMQGTGIAGASTTYCGGISDELQFIITDTMGEPAGWSTAGLVVQRVLPSGPVLALGK